MAEVKKTADFSYYLVFIGHLIFILAWLLSPFWLAWPLLMLFSAVLYMQSRFLGYCVLTRWQFGAKDWSFWVYYLGKLGIKVTKTQVTHWTRVFLAVSPIMGWLWQTWWG